MKKTLSIIITLFLLTSCSDDKFPQDNLSDIKVTSKEKIKFSVDTATDSPLYDNYNFVMTRTHYSDSSFNDSGLICSSDTATACSLTFKKNNGFWYVKTPDGWQEFYNPKDSLLKVVYFKAAKFILKPVGQNLAYNKKALLGFISEPLYVYTSHNSNLFFDKDFGVVVIDGDVTLFREDFKNKNNADTD